MSNFYGKLFGKKQVKTDSSRKKGITGFIQSWLIQISSSLYLKNGEIGLIEIKGHKTAPTQNKIVLKIRRKNNRIEVLNFYSKEVHNV